jgi:hypothetical protein
MKKFLVTSNLHTNARILAKNAADARSLYLTWLTDSEASQIVGASIVIVRA